MSLALSAQSSQAYLQDTRNDNVQVYVNGEFVHRDRATVSVFDSGYVCGDGVWEGLRLVNGKLIALQAHLDRLFAGAAAIQLNIGHSREELTDIMYSTLKINGMTDGAHLRLMITRGKSARQIRTRALSSAAPLSSAWRNIRLWMNRPNGAALPCSPRPIVPARRMFSICVLIPTAA